MLKDQYEKQIVDDRRYHEEQEEERVSFKITQVACV